MRPSFDDLDRAFSYDKDTGKLFWRLSKKGNSRASAGMEAGHLGGNGYLYVRHLGKTLLVHRIAWLLSHKEWPKAYVDHINMNATDNRLSNLRECNPAQNLQNRKATRRNKCGFKGVCRNTGRGKPWRATIAVNGKQKHVGTFDTPEEAGEAYLKAAKVYFGEFARAS